MGKDHDHDDDDENISAQRSIDPRIKDVVYSILTSVPDIKPKKIEYY